MIPKTGSRLPNGPIRVSERDYIHAISGALRGELGATGAATKIVMRWTGASERTARTWMTGAAGPSGHYLMSLAHESDAVLAAILSMTSRPELALGLDLLAVELAIKKASLAFTELRERTIRKP
ncbi:hypothetical protein [Sphingomonas sp. TZW2008]|uniref:hypothetical protein n=1 Tax=Sphingomonas sp. TZW2008 TaxID=1917973 RepID=UPI001181C3AA|nr:hypothetical protein [Sphingomonas sp. TZW2008]